MRISNVKHDLNSIRYYFDEQHSFYTSVEVYFLHQQQQLRAQLIFPFERKGNFRIEKIEVYHHEQWNDKKGNIEQYGIALAKNVMVVLLGNNINEMEQTAKLQLDASFQKFVQVLSRRLMELLQDEGLQFECETSGDFLSIFTRMNINGEVVAGKIATNVYFTNTDQAVVFAEQLAEKYKTEIVANIYKLQELREEIGEDQTIYVSTIPIVNPVSDHFPNERLLNVAIKSLGYCKNCVKEQVSQMGTNVKINPLMLEEHIDDLLILIVGGTLQCDQCGGVIKKEKLIIWDHQTDQLLRERLIDELMVLGQMKEHQSIQSLLDAAVEHESYFSEQAEQFWNAFSFVATSQWERFCQELTRFELLEGLRHFSDDIVAESSKEMLLKQVQHLVKSKDEKRFFWRKANERVIRHFLHLTVFGWELQKEIEIIGVKRGTFIFQYLPYPEVLKPYYQKYAAYFSENANATDLKQKNTIEKLQQQLRQLQQENGRLSAKLGRAYDSIDEIKKESFLIEKENRNPKDILKIQQLKGLIAELKEELAVMSAIEDEADSTKPETELSVEFDDKKEEFIPLETVYRGKKILILGGFRVKSKSEESRFTVLFHDARLLDPAFYDMLNQADIIIVLTRFISHRAMWEAKEYAILEEKEIYFSSFTNIPTILYEVAEKRMS